MKNVCWFYKGCVNRTSHLLKGVVSHFSEELTSVQIWVCERCLSDKGISGGSAYAKALWQEGARPRHVTERSPIFLLNREKGETESKTEIRGKAQKSAQILIQSVIFGQGSSQCSLK